MLILSDDLTEFAGLASKLDSDSRRVAVGLRDNYIGIMGKFDLKGQMGGKIPTVIAMDNPSEAYICEFGKWSGTESTITVI